MNLRFTESEKWRDAWFRGLRPEYKLAWLYIVDNCDICGVIDLDKGLADFCIGIDVDWETFLKETHGRILSLKRGRLWVHGFVAFQQKTRELNEKNPCHRGILKKAANHGINLQEHGYSVRENTKPHASPIDAPSKPHARGVGIGKGKGKGFKSKKERIPSTVEQVTAYATEQGWPLSEFDSNVYFDWGVACGWRPNGRPVKDWKASARSAHAKGWAVSQKSQKFDMENWSA